MCPFHYEMPLGYMGGIIMWILLIAALVLLVYFTVRAAGGGEKSGEVSENALDILKKRYAAGEISKEEFEEKKKDIL